MSVCVRVDMQKLAARLARLHGRAYARADVHLWLRENGFAFQGGNWVCDGEPGDRLQPGEMLEVIRQVMQDGVTFIERFQPLPSQPPE